MINPIVHCRLVLESIRTETGSTVGITTIFADMPEEALTAMQDILEGKIDRGDIPKTGLDLRSTNDDYTIMRLKWRFAWLPTRLTSGRLIWLSRYRAKFRIWPARIWGLEKTKVVQRSL